MRSPHDGRGWKQNHLIIFIYFHRKKRRINGNILGYLSNPSPLHLLLPPLPSKKTCKNFPTFLMQIYDFPLFFHQVQHFPPLFPILELFSRFSASFSLFFWPKKMISLFLPQEADFFLFFSKKKERLRFVSSIDF